MPHKDNSEQSLLCNLCLGLHYLLTETVSLPPGTALGDPIEVGAAAAVFFPSKGSNSKTIREGVTAERVPALPFLWSTVKGFGGHQEAAAGVTEVCTPRALVSLDSWPTQWDLVNVCLTVNLVSLLRMLG